MSQNGPARRFGGRWIKEGEQYRERNRALKVILSRFWYLLVPFLGIMYAHDSYVRPQTEDIKSIKNQERAQLLDSKDDLRVQRSNVQSEIRSVSDVLDTLYLPQIRFYGTVHDSLLKIRQVYDETLPMTKTRIDSLSAINEALVAEIDELSNTYRDRDEALDGLRAWRSTMQDSIVVLDDMIALKTDELFREQNPLEYRRRNALFTGEGDYPNRDDNPEREGGK